VSNSGPSLLGRQVAAPERYSPEVLEAIPRAPQRQRLGLGSALPFSGADLWTGWELSWLAPGGKPRVAVVRLVIPADSPAMVESKSLKLYLNSFNQEVLDDEVVRERIARDVGRCVGDDVEVTLALPNDWYQPLTALPGLCLDDQDVACSHYRPAPELLALAPGASQSAQLPGSWHSHLLRSLCPVTGQPDWATVWIDWHGPRLAPESLLQYLVSFRQHQDFHEHCVERIFADLWQRFRPQRLEVGARYLRRGGLDINPVRASQAGPWVDRRLYRQ